MKYIAKGRVVRLLSLLLLFNLGCGKSSPPEVPPASPNGETPGEPVGKNVDAQIKNAELQLLAGTWVYEKQIVRGKEIDAENMKDPVVISGTTILRHVSTKDGPTLPPIKSTLHIDPTVTPKQMDDDASVVSKISRRPGIYKLEGDRLTLCYDNTGKRRPTSFDSPPNSDLVLSVLSRKK